MIPSLAFDPQPLLPTLPTPYLPHLLPSNAETVCDAVDVVEPGGDEIDLKNAYIVEANGPQGIEVVGVDGGRGKGQLLDVTEHGAFAVRQVRRPPVFLECFRQPFIQGNETQKLCVRLHSVEAPVQCGDGRRDHLMVTPG